MNLPNEQNDDLELPQELAELDRELKAIQIAERPSFGPELLAELEHSWKARRPIPRLAGVGRLVAAGIAAILVVGLGAPQARAAIARLFPFLQEPVAEVTDDVEVTQPPAPVEFLDGEFSVEAAPEVAQAPEVVEGVAVPPMDAELPEVRGAREFTHPELIDREGTEEAIQSRYPRRLQRAGIGGTVQLRLWVTVEGRVEHVAMARSSGVPELDGAAMEMAPSLQFLPSRIAGVAVATWVEVPVEFRPLDSPSGGEALQPVQRREEVLDLNLPAEITLDDFLTVPSVEREAQNLLRTALGSDARTSQWRRSLDALVSGIPPKGVFPTQWRSDAALVLHRALERDADNPVPVFALARVRKDQGLRAEARALYEEAVRRAELETTTVSPALLAEMHFDLGRMIQEEWLVFRALGSVPAASVSDVSCPGWEGFDLGQSEVGVDALVAMNFLCVSELDRLLADEFEHTPAPRGSDHADMLQAFDNAVAVFPAHRRANVEVLLEQANQGVWGDVLDGAHAFIRASRGHPDGLLLSGLALHRLGHVEEAMDRFSFALEIMEDERRDALMDIRPLLAEEEGTSYDRLDASERAREITDFWTGLDPILSTQVNERQVEHLARATYALLRWGDVESEAAQVLIRYGLPSKIRAFGGGFGLRTIFWGYPGKPDVIFRRSARSLHLDLIPESRTHLDGLLGVLPHDFESSKSREVVALSGQVRVVTGESGGEQLGVRVRIPEVFRTSEGDDPVEVAIYLVRSNGQILESSLFRVPAQQPFFERRIETVPNAARIVVELFREGTPEVFSFNTELISGTR